MWNKNVFLILFLINFSFGFSQKIVNKSKPNETTFLNNTKKNQGFFTFFIKESKNQVLLEIDEFEKDFLYINSLSTGIGNNDIGLDRGQLGQERIVFFFDPRTPLPICPQIYFRPISEVGSFPAKASRS